MVSTTAEARLRAAICPLTASPPPTLAFCRSSRDPPLGSSSGTALAYSLVPDLRIFVLFSAAQYLYIVVAGVLDARYDTGELLRAQAPSVSR